MRALIILLLLCGCAVPKKVVLVEWIKARDSLEVERLCFQAGARSYYQILGCQFWRSGVCTVISPADEVLLGHEVRHCFDGRFH